jgi:predicted dehydrogenase
MPFDAAGADTPAETHLSSPQPATIRVGLIGCGAFARFSMAQYRQLPGVVIAAVADVHPDAARHAAAELNAAVVPPDALLTHPGLDLVYIATPPALHFPQARAALRAGKHVLVEKPLATTVADAEELDAVSTAQGRLCVANLIERYDPLAIAVKTIIDERLLGGLIHGLFMNEAADEGLGRGHWFWDRAVSGGIFVEHGVHFFDLVASWLGPGRVVSAERSLRPECDPPVEEQVMCTCRYDGVLFHFEHGFHQPSRMDRQEMRLVFERGEMRLFDWVPTHGTVSGLVDEKTQRRLTEILPGAVACREPRGEAAGGRIRGRFKPFADVQFVETSFTTGLDKLDLYGRVVRDLAADQIAWIRDPAHVRRLTEADSVAAVAMACAADQLAMAESASGVAATT